MLKRFFLGLLVAWAAAGFLYELNAAVSSYDQRERAVRRFAWRFGAPEPARLARCLRQAETEIPPDSTVAFASPDVPPRTAFQRWRWAAYLLADRDVLDVHDPAAAGTAGFAVSYRMTIEDPRFEPVRRLPCGCWLYRVRRP
ncbi:MAG TPA: hypothetical protein VHC97_21385 [Thermoanaerobaculia bacterium]|jgi:hypothetical protein|nr:hypothetical protein [Thermoanaerobaculia bacterium]